MTDSLSSHRPGNGAAAGLLVLLSLVAGACHAPERSGAAARALPSRWLEPMSSEDPWIADGDPEADEVVIFCQGGPSDSLDFVPGERTQWRYLPGYDKALRVFVHQSNTLHPEMFELGEGFTTNDAEGATQATLDLLGRAIEHHRRPGRRVVVVGHSYGAFVALHSIGSSQPQADLYVAIAGRLDVEAEVAACHLSGLNGDFVEGSGFVPQDPQQIADRSPSDRSRYRVKQLLKGVMGRQQQSKRLAQRDLSTLVYVHCPQDGRVGPTTPDELEFLRRRGAAVVSSPYPHGDALYGLVDAIDAGQVSVLRAAD